MRNKRSFGFTLIELLVVIAIIAILAAILLPAMNAAFRKAEEAQAKTEVKSIETAIKAYLNEYSKFPHIPNNNTDYTYGLGAFNNSTLMNVLRSISDANGNNNGTNNSRKIIFLEIAESSLATNNFVDPWGNQYRITVDSQFDNDCETPAASGLGTVQGRQVLVWSLGSQSQEGAAYTNNYVRAWK